MSEFTRNCDRLGGAARQKVSSLLDHAIAAQPDARADATAMFRSALEEVERLAGGAARFWSNPESEEWRVTVDALLDEARARWPGPVEGELLQLIDRMIAEESAIASFDAWGATAMGNARTRVGPPWRGHHFHWGGLGWRIFADGRREQPPLPGRDRDPNSVQHRRLLDRGAGVAGPGGVRRSSPRGGLARSSAGVAWALAAARASTDAGSSSVWLERSGIRAPAHWRVGSLLQEAEGSLDWALDPEASTPVEPLDGDGSRAQAAARGY